MRTVVLGIALASAFAGCSDDDARGRLPPDTAIDDKPPAITNQARVRITFHALGTANRFTCQLDSAAPFPCGSPFEAEVPDGDHTFQVGAAINATIDSTPAVTTWKVDTVAPDTTILSGPPALDNALAPEFSFEGTDAQGAVTLACALDGAAFAPCTSPATVAITDGSHSYQVRAVDAAGNLDPSPAVLAWVVDSTAPETMITAGPAPGSTTAAGVTFEFGSPDSPVTLECSLDGAVFISCTSPFTPAALADGSHTFAVRARDEVGLVDPSPATRTWTVDTTPPAVTVTDVASPTSDSTPSVAFTVTGATTIQCRVDAGAFVACTSPFTPAALADGSHTITVRGTDAAGNTGSDATTFTVDTQAPAVVFDDTPPAQWPVNYFDMRFHTTDGSAALTCSLNTAAFTPCASPLTITTSYDVTSTFSVRATDPAGNSSTVTASWTSSDGLVLHYPWEQGQTHNTSLLAQDTAYSPDGRVSVPVVGGWAGTAAGSPAAHTYGNTIRPLSSSANGGYTASIWVRVASDSNSGTILSTLTANNGFSLVIGGRQVTLRVNEGGRAFTATATIPLNQWVQLGLRTTGPTNGLQLLVNGVVVATAAPPVATGFGPGQARDLTVGAVAGVDLDDLRFYNRALIGNEICATLVRGQRNAQGVCVPLIPGFELDFENNLIRDTGSWGLTLAPPQAISFVPTSLGSGLRLPSTAQQFAYTEGFASNVGQAPGRSFSLWFVAGGSAAEILIDFLHPCAAGAPFTCGIRVTHSTAGGLTVIANAGGATPFTRTFTIPNGPHSVVVTEQRAATGPTVSLSIYIDGVVSVMPIGVGNVYANPSNAVLLPRVAGTSIDEYEFWPRDLSLDPEMLCENGWDGEWNPATSTCLLTAN